MCEIVSCTNDLREEFLPSPTSPRCSYLALVCPLVVEQQGPVAPLVVEGDTQPQWCRANMASLLPHQLQVSHDTPWGWGQSACPHIVIQIIVY